MTYIQDKTFEFGVRFGISIKDSNDLQAMLQEVYSRGVSESKQFIVLPPAKAYEIHNMLDVEKMRQQDINKEEIYHLLLEEIRLLDLNDDDVENVGNAIFRGLENLTN